MPIPPAIIIPANGYRRRPAMNPAAPHKNVATMANRMCQPRPICRVNSSAKNEDPIKLARAPHAPTHKVAVSLREEERGLPAEAPESSSESGFALSHEAVRPVDALVTTGVVCALTA